MKKMRLDTRIGRLPRPAGYSGLMEIMARTLGVDLRDALVMGDLSSRAIVRMMHHCSACGAEEECALLLLKSHARVVTAPDYCVNRLLMKKLKDLRLSRATRIDRSAVLSRSPVKAFGQPDTGPGSGDFTDLTK